MGNVLRVKIQPVRAALADHRMPIPLQEARLRLTGPAMRAARTVDLGAREPGSISGPGCADGTIGSRVLNAARRIR